MHSMIASQEKPKPHPPVRLETQTSWKRLKRSQSNVASMLVSVVIPAHNEERYLGRTLDSLLHQTYHPIEIIVVTNGCTDNTHLVAHGKCHHLLSIPEPGISRARNLGAEKASGRLLIFLDADTLLQPQAIARIVSEFSPHHAMGTLKGKPDTKKFSHHFIYFWKNFLHKTAFHYGSSGIIFCWKSAFHRVGGFDETLQIRENSHLMTRLRSLGSYRYIRSTTATTSMRRYEKKGTKTIVWLWFKVWGFSLFCDQRKKPYESVR